MTNNNAIELKNNNIESNSTPSMAVDVETSSAPTNESEYDENLRKKIKLTSLTWDDLKKMKHCHKYLGGESKNGTRHLLDHIAVCPMIKQNHTKQMLLKANSSSDGKSASLDTYHFNPEVSRYELGRMIVLHEYPLSMVEHEGFRRYSNSLQPLFKVPSRNTIKVDIFKMYESGKQKMQRVLESNSSRVAITTDMWTTSNQKRGYIAITAHFIDESWTLQDRIMRFMYVPSPDDVENLNNALMECLLDWNIERKLLKCLLDWNIERKLLTLTLDNCSTNDVMVNIMLNKLDKSLLLVNCKLLHLCCVLG
ncbi:hypothetical protein UlMin_014351 [Ulmus minor]